MYRLLAVLALVTLTGQGCFGFGGGNEGPDASSDGGVFVTPDAGKEWTQLTAVPGPRGSGTIAGTNVVTMEMDPGDRRNIYLGLQANGLFYSLDRGQTWNQARDRSLQSGKIDDIEVDPSDQCVVYIAKAQRLVKTENCLRSFDDEVYVETRSGVSVREAAVDWFNSRVVWMGLSNGDLLKSENGGETWRTVLNADEEISGILINQQDSRVILVATAEEGFYKTTDAGETWVHIEEELREFRRGEDVVTMTQDRASEAVIASTEFGLLRSTDFGDTWEPVSLLTSPGEVVIRAVAMDPTNPDAIRYAAANTFYVSNDGGSTWTTHNIPTTRRSEAMLVDPEENSVVYIGVARIEK